MSGEGGGGLDRPLAEALAEELVVASRLLGDLAYELGSDEQTLRRHMTSLQKIDLITQMQLAVVDVLRSAADGDEALTRVTLEATAERLRATMAQVAIAH